MVINKKRIYKSKFLNGLVRPNEKFVLGVKVNENLKGIIEKAGFSKNLEPGECVLPTGSFGPVSLYNAEGKIIKHKDKPMETAYRQIEWHWQEWHGPYNRIDQSKIVDVPYKRYPQSFLPPPAVELRILNTSNGDLIIASPDMVFNNENEEQIVHTANLILEIFRQCEIFKANLDEIIKVPITRLNWRILPSGKMPWQSLKKEVNQLVNNAPAGKRPVIEYRLENIHKYGPDFVAVGQGGFRGYIVFGFKAKNIFALESIYYGNATYLFGEKWEELSKKTKAEILNQNLQKDRIVHLSGWNSKINGWLKS